ncbi:MAG: hypothetical protein JWQ01_1969 [Massilia sp.]|jgi:hypothetical protein|nr:hypothetical protein [Massilia sp.]
MKRRDFLIAGTALAGTGLAPLALAAAQSHGAVRNQAAFQALVGQTFLAYENQRGVALELVAVTAGKSAPGHQQFSLSFRGAGATLKSGTYLMENGTLGRIDMYLEAREGGTWRAEFSLLG